MFFSCIRILSPWATGQHTWIIYKAQLLQVHKTSEISHLKHKTKETEYNREWRDNQCLLHSPSLGMSCNGALHDIPKDNCKGD